MDFVSDAKLILQISIFRVRTAVMPKDTEGNS